MPVGAAIIVAKEAAKKAIKETAKQVAKETKKDALKGKLKQAVKAEVKEEVKDKVVEEIDDKVMDLGAVRKVSSIAKGDGLKAKLSQAVKGEVRERVTDDINENIVDTRVVQKGKTALDVAKAPTESSEKLKSSDVGETVKRTDGESHDSEKSSLRDKLSNAVKDNSTTENVENKTTESSEIKSDTKKESNSSADEGTEKKTDSEKTEKDEKLEQEEKTEKYEPNSYVNIDGERYRTDDNGNIYQKRNPETATYEGIPNKSYELNGYHYETDGKGRIKKAEGVLQERNHEGRPTINDNVDGMKNSDEKGHLIGDQFNGSNLNGNLVAMDFDVNRSDYKRLEEKLSKAVNEDHKKVEYSIEPKYEGDSSRPTKFVVKYTVDGETFKETFKN